MNLRKYFEEKETTTDIIDNINYVDSMIDIYNRTSGHKIRIVATKSITEDIAVDTIDLSNKIKPTAIDEEVTKSIMERCGEKTKGKAVNIKTIKNLLQESYACDDTDYDVVELVFELVPDKYFVEKHVAKYEENNKAYLSYICKNEGFKPVGELEEYTGTTSPDVEKTSLISQKIIFPVRRHNTFKIKGKIVVVPLIRYQKYSKINANSVMVNKPIASKKTYSRDNLLRYYTITKEDGVYYINFSKIKLNIFKLLESVYGDDASDINFWSERKLWNRFEKSYEAYYATEQEEVSRSILDYMGQMFIEDVLEVCDMIHTENIKEGIRFDCITGLTVSFLKYINNEFSKIEPTYITGTRTVKKSADIANMSKKVNIKPHVFISALRGDDAKLCDYMNITNSFTITGSLKFKDYSSRERTFLMEQVSYEDPIGAVLDGSKSEPAGAVPLYMDRKFLEV